MRVYSLAKRHDLVSCRSHSWGFDYSSGFFPATGDLRLRQSVRPSRRFRRFRRINAHPQGFNPASVRYRSWSIASTAVRYPLELLSPSQPSPTRFASRLMTTANRHRVLANPLATFPGVTRKHTTRSVLSVFPAGCWHLSLSRPPATLAFLAFLRLQRTGESGVGQSGPRSRFRGQWFQSRKLSEKQQRWIDTP
jgi:hypothetical protein